VGKEVDKYARIHSMTFSDYTFQDASPSCPYYKVLKIKIYETITLPPCFLCDMKRELFSGRITNANVLKQGPVGDIFVRVR
jgi:hypothetical protein